MAVRSAAIVLFLLAGISGLRAQSPVVAYIIPDIGTPGMNTYVEIIGPYNRLHGFGTDNIYTNNPGDQVQVVCDDPADTSKVRFGPCVVSWNGRMIGTQVFVLPTVVATSTDWNTGIKIPIRVIVNGVASNTDTFYIVKPQNLGINHIFTGGGQFGSGTSSGVNFGFRSRRGAMIVDSLILLGSGSYGVSTIDCDPIMIGNQGYLPFTLISKGPITLGASTFLDVNARGIHAGVGGGGGGNGLICGTTGGDGYTGGGGNSDWINSNCGSNMPAGIGTGSGADALDGMPGGGSSNQNEGGGGGAGHPFGASGSAGGLDNDQPVPVIPGYGGGTGGPQCCDPQHDGGGGGGAYGTNGGNGGSYRGSNSGGLIIGNPEIVPFAGGSGGGGGNVNSSTLNDAGSGGGAGGAIAMYGLVTSANGSVMALGAKGQNSPNNGAGGGGSGGGVLLGAKLSIGVNAVDVSGATGGTGKPVNAGQDGGIGGSGRVRFDGKAVGAKPNVTPSATLYHGPTTDTSGWVNKIFTLTGSGNGKDIRIYVRPLSGTWALATTVTGYNNTWSATVTLPGKDNVFLLAAAQQVTNPNPGVYTAEPNWILSQAGANILHSYCAGPALTLSKQQIDLGSVSICSEIFDTIVVDNVGCDTAHVLKSLDDPTLGVSLFHTGVSNLPNQLSDTIIVRFKPKGVGPISTTLRIKFDHGENDLTVTGIGTSGDTALTPSPRLLSFDTVSICTQLTREIVFTNTGCDSITVKNVGGPTLGDFTLGNSLIGRKMHIGDTASLQLSESGTGPGTKLDSVVLTVENATGVLQQITAYVVVTIVPRQRLMSFTNVARLDSLAPCTPFDTTLWIKNLGVCDTLTITNISATGFGQLSTTSALPKRVLPGDSLALSVHVTGSNFMTGTATVHVQGNGLDTTFTIQTTTRRSGAPFTLSVTDSIFSSSFCDHPSETFTFHNASCNPVVIDSTSLSGSGQFSIKPTPSQGITIQPGDSLALTVTFDPTKPGDSLATLYYHSALYNITRSIALRGTLNTAHQGATVVLSLDPTAQAATVRAGNTILMDLTLRETIPASIPVTSVQVALDFNSDLVAINPLDIFPLPGFTLGSSVARTTGEDLSFNRTGTGAIAAGTPIAKINFGTYVTDTDKTTIRVGNIGYNQFDSLFELCVLTPLAGSSVDVGLTDFCSKASLIHYLKTGNVADRVVVSPDPVPADHGAMTLSFDLHAATTIDVMLLDILGNVIQRSVHEESVPGAKSYRIATDRLTSGTYIVRLRTPLQVVSVPVVVTR